MVATLKVLLISEHYFPIKGGSATYVYNLCKSLSQVGCEVFLVTIPDDKTQTLKWEKTDNFYVYRLKIPKLLRKERFFQIFLAMKIKGIIKEVNPKVLHFAHGFFAPAILKLVSVRQPVFWTVQNIPPHEHKFDLLKGIKPINSLLKGVYFYLGRAYARFALKNLPYDSLICVSEKTARVAVETGAPDEKVEVINNGVDVAIFSPSRENQKFPDYNPIILTVAGITYNKGLRYLMEAAPRIIESYPKALFLIIGPIRSMEYYDELLRLMSQLGIKENVKIIPGVEPEKINSYYSLADVYVQPSLEEGFCMSVLEAMSCEKPVVGTKTGAIPQLINESGGGVLVEPASPEQLSNALLKLLADPVERKNMGIKARKYVIKNYSWEKIASETLALYQRIIQR